MLALFALNSLIAGEFQISAFSNNRTGDSRARGLMASQSTPELGGSSMASLLEGDITAVDAKQVRAPVPHLVSVFFALYCFDSSQQATFPAEGVKVLSHLLRPRSIAQCAAASAMRRCFMFRAPSPLPPSPACAGDNLSLSQLLRCLRQQTKTARHRRHGANTTTAATTANARSGARTSRPSFKEKRGGKGPAQSPPRTGVGLSFPPFSPPDAWDDTGLFTVAPRPKTVPSRNPSRSHHDHQQQRPTLASHTLASPVFASRTSDSSSCAVAVPPGSNGRSVDGSAVVGTMLPSELWQKGQDIGLGRSGSSSDGFGLWPKRRRKVTYEHHDR